MRMPYRVIQWATGNVGKQAVLGALAHPELELVGCRVYGEDKEGRDAGDLIGAAKTGIVATRDVDAILALDADCVLYCPLPWDLGEICRLLESGIHVITPCPYWFPFVQSPDVAAAITTMTAAIRAAERNDPTFRLFTWQPRCLSSRDRWLCVPASRRVCLSRWACAQFPRTRGSLGSKPQDLSRHDGLPDRARDRAPCCGNPAIVGQSADRPEALRPRLSTGLP